MGTALKRGLEGARYEVKSAGRDPKEVRAIADWGELLIPAIPFGVITDALREMGDAVQGKVLLDVTNALTPDYQLALGLYNQRRGQSPKESADSESSQGAPKVNMVGS